MSENRRARGLGQLRDIVTDNIRDRAITAAKLNADIAGNGLELDPTTNAINFVGETIVTSTSELQSALASGETTIRLLNGTYSISSGIIVTDGQLRLIGESKENVILDFTPSGYISVDYISGDIIAGTADLSSSNPGVVDVHGVTSGTMPQFSWQNSYIVFDDIPYKVRRVTSGDISGDAQIELIDPYTQESFSGKSFELMYLSEDFRLQNLTVNSANSVNGIVNIERAKNVTFDNVKIRGRNVLTANTYGVKLNRVYSSTMERVDFVGIRNKHAIDIRNSHFLRLEDFKMLNNESDSIYIEDSSYLIIDKLYALNIDGSIFDIVNSDNIGITDSRIFDYNDISVVSGTTNLFIENTHIKSDNNTLALRTFNTSININDSTFENSYVELNGSNNNRSIIQSNTFDFNSTTSYALTLNGIKAAVNTNFFENASIALNGISGAILRVANNDINSGQILFDSSITDSTLDNNTINPVNFSGVALVVAGSGNFISNNVILNSGQASVAPGNQSTVIATLTPFFSGSIDIGSTTNPYRDGYFDGTINATTVNTDVILVDSLSLQNLSVVNDITISGNIITNSGNITGLDSITLSGHVITASSGAIYVDGELITGSGGNGVTISGDISGSIGMYTHVQSTAQTVWTINHNLDTEDFGITIYDNSGTVFIPDEVDVVTSNTVQITNLTAQAGKAILIARSAVTTVPNNLYIHSQSSASTTWTVNHFLGTENFNYDVYDISGNAFIPLNVRPLDANTVEITHTTPSTGKAVFSFASAGVQVVSNGLLDTISGNIDAVSSNVNTVSGNVDSVTSRINTNSTDWISYSLDIHDINGPITKSGTINFDVARYRRNGPNIDIVYNYKQSSIGEVGTGLYVFRLPDIGITINSGVVPFVDIGNDIRGGVVGSASVYDASDYYAGTVNAYDSSGLAMFVQSTSTASFVESTFLSLASNASLNYSFNASVPINEWSVDDIS